MIFHYTIAFQCLQFLLPRVRIYNLRMLMHVHLENIQPHHGLLFRIHHQSTWTIGTLQQT